MPTRAELDAARDLLPLVRAAATRHGVDVYVLLGIISRESRFGLALDASGRGDDGHGHGLCQIDDRSHGEWLASHDWHDAAVNIDYGARVLAGSVRFFELRAGEIGRLGASPLRAGIAAYNRGPGNILRDLRRGLPVDHFTAHGDYSADVLRRSAWFRAALEPPPLTPKPLEEA